jgi:hypothetical protein
MLVDAARAQSVHDHLIALGPESRAQSLYQGDIGANLSHVSPWLVTMSTRPEAAWFAETGFGQSWGVFVVSDLGFEDVRRHLRKFNLVTGPTGQMLAFRFYDPRVMRVFLPACEADERYHFFGPLQGFLVETEDGSGILRFTLEAGAIREVRLGG